MVCGRGGIVDQRDECSVGHDKRFVLAGWFCSVWPDGCSVWVVMCAFLAGVALLSMTNALFGMTSALLGMMIAFYLA